MRKGVERGEELLRGLRVGLTVGDVEDNCMWLTGPIVRIISCYKPVFAPVMNMSQ